MPAEAQIEAGNYRKQHRRFAGLDISIENPVGSVRSGTDRNGKSWRIKMRNAYGYIRGSMGVDGDHVDCYLGPDEDAPMVYVVHQRKVGDWSKFDEDKCMLGFASEKAARDAFLAHYTDPRFLGPITAMPIDEFKTKVLATKDRPKMIKALLFFKAHNAGYTYTKNGKTVRVDPFDDKRVKAVRMVSRKDDRTADLFGATESEKPAEMPTPSQAGHDRLVETLKRGDHAGAVKMLKEMPYEEAHEAVARAGFRIPKHRETTGWLLSSISDDLASAARLKMNGHELSNWQRDYLARAREKNRQKSTDTIQTPRAEMVKEHERLVDVLNSPSHKDDKVEAKKQEKELQEYKAPKTPKFDPAKQVRIAADSVKKLRRPDVERVLTDGLSTAEQQAAVASYIKTNRPDLTDEVDDIMADDDLAIKPTPNPTHKVKAVRAVAPS